jgi:hypothetical protein
VKGVLKPNRVTSFPDMTIFEKFEGGVDGLIEIVEFVGKKVIILLLPLISNEVLMFGIGFIVKLNSWVK